MADTFERRREEVITFVSNKLVGATDSRATAMTRRYCKTYNIPANSMQMVDMANEAIRRRMVAKIKALNDQLIQLNNKVNSFHP